MKQNGKENETICETPGGSSERGRCEFDPADDWRYRKPIIEAVTRSSGGLFPLMHLFEHPIMPIFPIMPILQSSGAPNQAIHRILAITLACLASSGCDRNQVTEKVPPAAAQAAAPKAGQSKATADAAGGQTPSANQPAVSGPTIRWEFQADEAIEATPAISAGRVIIGDVMGKLYAIDYETGEQLWKVDYETGFLAAAIIDHDTVVIGDVEGNLYCLDAADGSQRWKAETGGEINGSAAFYQDKVLVASQDGKLYCFGRDDGTPVWEYQTDDQIRCSPTIAGDRTFLGGCDGRLHVVDLITGQAASEPLPLDGPTGSTPVVSGSLVVVPIMDGVIYAFDWKQPKLLWTHQDNERPQEYRNSPAIGEGLVIVSSQFKQVDAISLTTGQRVWRHTLRRRADASPVIAGDDVWIAATDGRLIRLELATGKPRQWSYESRGEFYAAPLIVGNDLLIADDNGVVRRFTGITNETE